MPSLTMRQIKIRSFQQESQMRKNKTDNMSALNSFRNSKKDPKKKKVENRKYSEWVPQHIQERFQI